MPDQDPRNAEAVPPPVHPEGYAQSFFPLLVRVDWDESLGDLVLGDPKPTKVLIVVPLWSCADLDLDAHCNLAIFGALQSRYGRCPASCEATGSVSEIVVALIAGDLATILPSPEVSGLPLDALEEMVGTGLADAYCALEMVPPSQSPDAEEVSGRGRAVDLVHKSMKAIHAASVRFQERTSRAHLN